MKSLQLSTAEEAALRTHIVQVLSTPHLEPSFKSGTIIPYSSCFHPHCTDREIEAYPQSTRVWILMVPVLCVCLLLTAGCFMPLCVGFPGAYETQGLAPSYVFMGSPLCWDLEFQVSHSSVRSERPPERRSTAQPQVPGGWYLVEGVRCGAWSQLYLKLAV